MINIDLLVISGPNLNLLGRREPNIYGRKSLEEIYSKIKNQSKKNNLNVECIQSNSESKIIKLIHEATNNVKAIIINPGAFTHTSIAIRDALSVFDGKIIEVHLSNPHDREKFRHLSLISGVSSGVIAGFGENSYYLAIEAVKLLLNMDKTNE